MTEHKALGHAVSLSAEEDRLDQTTERNARELKLAELTGEIEFLSQAIALSQGQSERLNKEVEDCKRLQQQAEIEFQERQKLSADKRQEINALEIDIKKNEACILSQEERIRTLFESVEIAEQRSKQSIEAIQVETGSKIKAIHQSLEAEKERLSVELNSHRSQTQMEMKQLTEEILQNRKKQERALEVEIQDMKRKAKEEVKKLLQDGRHKNEAQDQSH